PAAWRSCARTRKAATTPTAWGGTFVILLQSSLFLRLLGEKGVNALERLMGLILVMMATQMFLDGIRMWMKG
ncbi:MarC family protein, partial [Pseudomonas aeruginosa]